jgi:tetratricopeptide (TPR) repeat protein
MFAGMFFVLLPILSVAATQDWPAQVRKLAAERQFAQARAVVEARLAANPQDMEALGWRGRVNAWEGHWQQAEQDYRRVLEAVPQESEIMLALTDVLTWQSRFEDALAMVERSLALARGNALQAEVQLRRGRILRRLGRAQESRAAFEEVLRLEPANVEAKTALQAGARPLRHELRFGFENDRFNFTDAAQAYTLALRSEVSSRWVMNGSLTFFHRFGEQPVGGAGAVTYRASRHDALTVGGGGARDRGVIAHSEFFFAYNRGMRISETAPIRGVEMSYAQRWLWFDGARVLTAAPGLLLYLPRDWTLSLQGTAARSRFTGTPAEWRPSGTARLSFPVHRKLTLHTFFAAGTENFARVDQVGRFSARTWGGGGRWNFDSRQDLTFYAGYQDRSQGRTQTSFGMSYGFRF